MLEVSHPEEVLEVSEPADAILDVGLLQRRRIAVLGAAACLVGQPLRDVFVFVVADALLPHLALELLEEGFVAGDSAGLDERGFGLHVLIGQADAVFHRAHRMTDFEADVPQCVQQPAGPLGEDLQFRTLRAESFGVQEHQVDVAEGIEFTTSVTAEGHQRHLGGLSFGSGEHTLDRNP